MERKSENYEKRITTIALVVALVASQSVCTFAANSPGTGPVISDGGNDDGSSYDAGTRTNTTAKTGTTTNTVQFGGVQTNSRGRPW